MKKIITGLVLAGVGIAGAVGMKVMLKIGTELVKEEIDNIELDDIELDDVELDDVDITNPEQEEQIAVEEVEPEIISEELQKLYDAQEIMRKVHEQRMQDLERFNNRLAEIRTEIDMCSRNGNEEGVDEKIDELCKEVRKIMKESKKYY